MTLCASCGLEVSKARKIAGDFPNLMDAAPPRCAPFSAPLKRSQGSRELACWAARAVQLAECARQLIVIAASPPRSLLPLHASGTRRRATCPRASLPKSRCQCLLSCISSLRCLNLPTRRGPLMPPPILWSRAATAGQRRLRYRTCSLIWTRSRRSAAPLLALSRASCSRRRTSYLRTMATKT